MEIIMYDHIGLRVSDLQASLRFYVATLATLGLTVCTQDASSAGLGPKGEPALWLYKATKGAKGTGTHIALRAPNRSAVDRFHQEGLKAGGRDNGAPGLRTDYSPNYYATFLIDPDGNNVEAVCQS
jgi:catechol 2,3-dioxygenase-like lactoylglutathione lyase family enzyme